MNQEKANSILVRKEKNRQKRRGNIIQAAERVFLNKRYQNATIEDIASEAEISVGTIYNFFPNKETLYIEILHGISADLLEGLRRSVSNHQEPNFSLEHLIQLRLSNYHRHKLFFQIFLDHGSSTYPDFNAIPATIIDSYHEYLERLGDYLIHSIQTDHEPQFFPIYLALSFEGFLNAYMGYEATTPKKPESLVKVIRYIKCMFSRMNRSTRTESKSKKKMIKEMNLKEIFVTKYDLARLTDLILVSRSLSNGFADVHLQNLAKELNRAKIVDQKNVPTDVVTMNSKVRLLDIHSGEESIYTLVFPSDKNGHSEKLSILSPLGTALIGYRVGDVFEITDSNQIKSYRIEDLLYQPESSGNYSL